GNHGHLTMNQISRQCGQPFVLIPGEAIFDSDVLTLDKACVFQTLTERGEELWGVVGCPGGEDPDHRHRRLLRARRRRPCDRHARGTGDERASFNSIPAWAVAGSVDGTSSPSALAVLRLITVWCLVGNCTGRSAAFSPLKIRLTSPAARRYSSKKLGP